MDNNVRNIEIYDSINEIYAKYGSIHIPRERLNSLGIDHILIKESGYILFSVLGEKGAILEIVGKDFRKFVDENIKGFKGVYGYNGVNTELLQEIKSLKEDSNEKVFSITLEYEGDYYVVNSGRYGGMVIITEGFQKINLKKVD